MSAVKDGWGWVQSPSVTGDIFLGLRDNPHLVAVPAIGDQLEFQMEVDPKSGRFKALNVAARLNGQRVQGTVSAVRDGGWGFATGVGVDGTVMLGKRNLTLAGIDMLQVGQVLEFDLNNGPKGYEALNIQLIGA
jgi:cold shock CspA family protein